MGLRSVWYSAVYAFDRTFRTGKRRAEFEHKYGTAQDYFGYHSKPYELEKYARTLKRALEWRKAKGSALEIGCSVGVFTRMIAGEFDTVTAVDISQEALGLAAAHVGETGQVSYARSDILELSIDKQFDVIFCAEVLMYVREADGARVCAVLDRHLAPGGIVIEVCQHDRTGNRKFFLGWDRILGAHYQIVGRDVVMDETRPYEIVAYARS